MLNRSIVLSTGLVLSLLPTPLLHAHTIDVPTSVQADADGHFAYDMIVTFGPGGAVVASWHWIGIQNVSDGLWADCFCNPGCLYEEGETLIEHIQGQLDDPTAPGIVENGVEFCSDPALIVNTTIHPSTAGTDEQPAVSPVIALRTNPNPLRFRTAFTFTLTRSTQICLRIYDVTGRLIDTADEGLRSAGVHTVSWSARDATGSALTSGTYFAVLETDGAVVTDRLSVVR